MSDSNGLLIAAIIAVLLIAFFILMRILKRKRAQAMVDVAPTIGFLFEGDTWADPSQAPPIQMPLFERKRDSRFANIMTGGFAGLRTSIFDYSYRSGRNVHTQTVVAFTFSQDLALPLFEVVPNNFFIRTLLPAVRSVKTIAFDSNPEFAKRFLVFGLREEEVRELFAPALLSFLEGLPPKELWRIEGLGATLMFYRTMGIMRPENLQSHLEKTSSLARGFVGSGGLKKIA
jgi:hypothetical protein